MFRVTYGRRNVRFRNVSEFNTQERAKQAALDWVLGDTTGDFVAFIDYPGGERAEYRGSARATGYTLRQVG